MNLRRLAQRVLKIIRIFIKSGAYVGIAALILMMLVTVSDVFLRYVFNRPILGSIEIVKFLLIIVAFLAIPYCALEDGHVKMDFAVSRLPPRGQTVIEIVGYIFCLVLTITMTCLYIPEAIEMRRVGERSIVLGIPAYPLYLIIFVACLMLSLVLLVNLIKSVARLMK